MLGAKAAGSGTPVGRLALGQSIGLAGIGAAAPAAFDRSAVDSHLGVRYSAVGVPSVWVR